MKNIQILYKITLFFLVCIFVFSQYRVYKNIQHEMKVEIENFNNLFAETIESKLHKVELILDMIGSQLLYDGAYRSEEKRFRIMKQMMGRVPDMAGFGITDPVGNFITMSNNIDPAMVKKFLSSKDTYDGFKRTLSSKAMTVGKVYHFKRINRWIVPLRKALRDSSGKVIGVITTGIMLNGKTRFFKNKPLLPDQVSLIVNDIGLWRVYISPIKEKDYPRFYSIPVSQSVYKNALIKGTSSLGMNAKTIRESETPFYFEGESKILHSFSMNAIKYNKRYKLWVVSLVPSNSPVKIFMERDFIVKVLLFILALAIFIILFGDIYKKEKKSREKLAYQALHDPLTDLYNRSALKHLSLDWIGVDEDPFILLFIDLDNFKHLNDAFSHSYGDAVLIEVAKRLTEFTPENSEVIRHGGDEFAIFIKINKDDHIGKYGKSILEEISRPYTIFGMQLHIGASIGISRFPNDGVTIEQLVIMADLAMYDAKKRRNSYALYNNDLQGTHRKAIIENQLRTALEKKEMFMVFQPQINRDGTIHGAEALVRWNNSSLGSVPPNKFIGVAEDSGLMETIGTFILETSCSEYSKIIRTIGESGEYLSLSINVSAKQVFQKNFKEQLLEILDKHQMKRESITIEITESLFIGELDYVLPMLEEIRETGITISLDDFGTGYSSLSMLGMLPINELKIDRSFISNVDKDSTMTRTIIDMGHNLRMKVLAEGVEEKKQFDILSAYGCDQYQGFYFSRPLSSDEFIDFFKSENLA